MNKPANDDDFIPERDDPKIVRARLLKNPTKRRWHNVAPENGWDNPNDIETAEHYLKTNYESGFLERKHADAPKLQWHADYLRGLGISEELAVKLIKDSGVPFSR